MTSFIFLYFCTSLHKNTVLPRILLIDNYDSFTYNLEHYLVSSGAEVEVILNDKIELGNLLVYDGIVLSPGPGLPKDRPD